MAAVHRALFVIMGETRAMKRKDLVKREISHTLKELCKVQSLPSITVSKLCSECGISRGTFYYHFLDILDLINWTAEEDIFKPLLADIETWSYEWNGIIRKCLQNLYDNKEFYCQAVKMEGPNCPNEYFKTRNLECWDIVVKKYVHHTGQEYDETTLRFLTQYTSQAIVNMTIDWAREGMKTPVDTLAYLFDIATYGLYRTTRGEPMS